MKNLVTLGALLSLLSLAFAGEASATVCPRFRCFVPTCERGQKLVTPRDANGCPLCAHCAADHSGGHHQCAVPTCSKRMCKSSERLVQHKDQNGCAMCSTCEKHESSSAGGTSTHHRCVAPSCSKRMCKSSERYVEHKDQSGCALCPTCEKRDHAR